MAKNISEQNLIQKLINDVADLTKKLEEAKTNQLKRIVLPKYNGTPSGVVDGEIWYDTSSNKAKKRENGATKDFNTA